MENLTSKARKSELIKLTNDTKNWDFIQSVYRGIKEVPSNMTWIEICNQYEMLLKKIVRIDYLNQCSYTK